MKATVLYISEKGNHALLSIEREDSNTGIVNGVSGFTKISKNFKAKKGEEIDLPYDKVSTEQSMSETGTVFTHLAFS